MKSVIAGIFRLILYRAHDSLICWRDFCGDGIARRNDDEFRKEKPSAKLVRRDQFQGSIVGQACSSGSRKTGREGLRISIGLVAGHISRCQAHSALRECGVA
jgi:hypothetical protein